MLELFTKNPDAALQVLRSAGAQCGSGAPPDLAKACPAERLCKLQGSEVCVQALSESVRPGDAPGASAAIHPIAALGSGLGLVLIGVLIGWVLRRP